MSTYERSCVVQIVYHDIEHVYRHDIVDLLDKAAECQIVLPCSFPVDGYTPQ